MRSLLLGDYGPDACPACGCSVTLVDNQSVPSQCQHCRAELVAMTPAALSRRFAAGFLDALLVAGPILPLNYWLSTWTFESPYDGDVSWLVQVIDFLAGDVLAQLMAYFPTFFAFGLYYLLFHALFGQTPGQRWMGVGLVDLHAKQPSFARVGVRVASFALVPLTFGLSTLWCLFDPRKQTAHDYLAQTMLVQRT